jgi:hypothetical protein
MLKLPAPERPIVMSRVTGGRALASVMVPETPDSSIVCGASRFASAASMAARSDPGPLSAVLVTV